ncbi:MULTISPECIES: DMT family transporter [unclassified Breznakia]|uniref:DMT family transporter n=1 Tax=unclassified Breznakia TaxID=2623764 RepID=UPI0024747B65|nr:MULTISPECIES: DMT family transporter [unclassified Breznakia]MDH6366303.1 drug/metabolite transporter (DMT)-like permease [Breznakia sp. PH1-1]MDH6403396.1 drug/metabolite transporter (DMT)-like permease [Breznakia sp. PF1-11]MDH6411105.1 drug/metabolite transporter (DMT)-like permease [Breznakia sp. PFB1-11]MDH6413469.1 drug/metabolite transporter (DMT)-like permease [Breznakia sp. PFB1-14]MDH6416742.1 drug/metabolite transporter (DMT)-like permease [Breznakia sp. PFB1-4]
MISGLLAGLLWGLDTVILGLALASSSFVSTEQAIFLAPFVSTFLHDACSSIWMFIYMIIRRQLPKVLCALKTKSGKYIMLGALLGGPVGMSGYVSAIQYIGPTFTAIISATFPAVGALLSYVFLKEKMKPYQIIGLIVAIIGVICLGYSPENIEVKNVVIGFLCALLCVFGWASEAVICAYGMRDPDVNDEQALQIRQCTSAIFYGIVILTIISGWKLSVEVMQSSSFVIIGLSALFGTASYLFYYKAINSIGASKAMALNVTYSAWSVIFSFLILGTMPTVQGIVFGLVIILGSLLAATDINDFVKKKKYNK